MQPIIKNIFLVILLLFSLIAFSNSYSFLNIDNLAFVVALGLDVSESNNVKVTFQFVNQNPNNEGANDDSKIVVDSIESSSIPNAINVMNAYLDKKIDLSHCKAIIFSEALASKDITNYIYSLMNDVQVRPSSNVIVSKCEAIEYIKNSEPSLETSVTKFYQTFPKSSKYTGYISDATIGDFFNALVCNSCEAHCILGGLKNSNESNNSNIDKTNSNMKAGNSTITAVRRTENLGIAAFKHGTLVGELNVSETVCYHIIQNDINSFLISVPNPEKEDYLIDIILYSKSNPSIKTKIINGSAYIKIKCEFSGKLSSISEDSKYLNNDILELISNSCNNYLSENLTDYLYKTSLIYKSDINALGRYVLPNFLTNQDFEAYNWPKNYTNTIFDVEINTDLESAYFITQT